MFNTIAFPDHKSLLSNEVKLDIIKSIHSKFKEKSPIIKDLLIVFLKRKLAEKLNYKLPHCLSTTNHLLAASQLCSNKTKLLLIEKALFDINENEAKLLLKLFDETIKGKYPLDHIDSGFLFLLASDSGVEIKDYSFYQAAIIEGKIYWRSFHYDASTKKVKNELNHFNQTNITLKENQVIHLSYDQFATLKNAGKRHSNAYLEHKEFIDFFKNNFTGEKGINFVRNTKTAYNKFKTKVLTEHNLVKPDGPTRFKLSPVFNCLSNTSIDPVLYANWVQKGFPDYPQIYGYLNQLLDFKSNKINPKNGLYYRKNRNIKTWDQSKSGWGGRINSDKNKVSKAHFWDVSIYKQLKSYRWKKNNVLPYEKHMDFDHLPADAVMKSLTDEGDKNILWCIALPTILHKSGLSYGQPANEQIKSGLPFHNCLERYLTLIAYNPSIYRIFTTSDYLKALGAFRYLYRRQVKPLAAYSCNKTKVISDKPQQFFNTYSDHKKRKALTDGLLTKEIQNCLQFDFNC